MQRFAHVFREVQRSAPDFSNVHEVFETLRGIYFLAAHRDGRDHMGMPFGIQVIGPPGADAHVLQVAHALEEVLALDAEMARPLPHLAM